jgi:uncharacterized protein DUF6516
MTSRDDYRSLLQLLTSTTVITKHRIDCDEPDIYAADLKGALDLIDGSTPFFAQSIRIEGPDRDQLFREQYRNHWQGPTGETRDRWDNARHHGELATFPDHLPMGPHEEAQECDPADLWRVMALVEHMI